MIREKIIENIGVIYLDRPKQINAINTEMVNEIMSCLKRWENDDNIKAILFDSLYEKGFCAGGDIKEVYTEYLTNDECNEKAGFFKKEFELDKYIMSYKKPIISHWFGVTMGGGLGLTIYSDFIITDETLNWAMPETILGFTPDVGVDHYIAKLPQAVGQYVGLTGASLSASDVIKYGFADLYIDSSDYEEVISILYELSKTYEGDRLIEEFGNKASNFKRDLETSEIEQKINDIEKYFSYESFYEIYKALEENLEDDFAKKSFDELISRDSFMLTVQFEKYFVDQNLTPEETIDLDLKILKYAIDRKSIHEGIRAKIIDKDNNPDWPVKSLNNVSIDEVKYLLEIDNSFKESQDLFYKGNG